MAKKQGKVKAIFLSETLQKDNQVFHSTYGVGRIKYVGDVLCGVDFNDGLTHVPCSNENLKTLVIEYEIATVKEDSNWIYKGHTLDIIENQGIIGYAEENGNHYKLSLVGTEFESKYPSAPYTFIWEKDLIISKVIIPLKHSQWNPAIKQNEIDSFKTVDFEIKYIVGDSEFDMAPDPRVTKKFSKFAKIIPSKKKFYSEEDMKNMCLRAWSKAIDKANWTESNANFKPIEFNDWWEQERY